MEGGAADVNNTLGLDRFPIGQGGVGCALVTEPCGGGLGCKFGARRRLLVFVKVEPLLVGNKLKVHGLPLLALLDLARDISCFGAFLGVGRVERG